VSPTRGAKESSPLTRAVPFLCRHRGDDELDQGSKEQRCTRGHLQCNRLDGGVVKALLLSCTATSVATQNGPVVSDALDRFSGCVMVALPHAVCQVIQLTRWS
jgi:hypothetical protein